MDRVSRYILSNFFPLFSSLFFTLFFLVSVIFFITLSRLTALISVNFWDLSEIFLYAIPEIISYTFPITFFIAIAMTVFSLSKDNEMIVLFALSMNPAKIARLFLGLSIIASIFLLLNVIFFMPLSKQLSSNFIALKKMEAKLNFKESEFGQKFANWHVFVQSNTKNVYNNIVLYQRGVDGKEDKFILAKEAKLDRKDALVNFRLYDGKVFSLSKEKLTQVDYAKLKMSYNPKMHQLTSSEIIDYWEKAKSDPKRATQLAFSILIGLFPLATFLYALSFGIAHMRHQKPNVYLNTMIVVLLYYVAIYKLAHKFPFYGTIGIFVFFSIVGMIVFKKRVLERF